MRFALSLVAFVAVWAIVATLVHQPDRLPEPAAVATYVVDQTLHGRMLFNMGMTLWRATSSFFIAMAIGCGLGFVFGRYDWADRAFMPWVLVVMNTPVLVIAFLCYIWIGLNESAAIVAVVLSKFPNNTVIVRDGVRTFDPGLDDIAAVYRFSPLKRFWNIFLPQATPFVIAAARSGIGIVWKIVLVIELFGLSSGVGFQMYTAFQYGGIKEIIGYAAAFAAVMLAIEFLLLQPLDDYARRWRTSAP